MGFVLLFGVSLSDGAFSFFGPHGFVCGTAARKMGCIEEKHNTDNTEVQWYHKKCTDLRLTKSTKHFAANSLATELGRCSVDNRTEIVFLSDMEIQPSHRTVPSISTVSGEVESVTICVQLWPMEDQSILRL